MRSGTHFEIELEAANNAVDGKIVDLNRISLPADTLIFDERFKDEKK